jgi:hypothetical protein
VFELSVLAVPDQVPLEFKVIPVGIVPEVLVKVILSPSGSVAVIVVKPDDALFVLPVGSFVFERDPLVVQSLFEQSV